MPPLQFDRRCRTPPTGAHFQRPVLERKKKRSVRRPKSRGLSNNPSYTHRRASVLTIKKGKGKSRVVWPKVRPTSGGVELAKSRTLLGGVGRLQRDGGARIFEMEKKGISEKKSRLVVLERPRGRGKRASPTFKGNPYLL